MVRLMMIMTVKMWGGCLFVSDRLCWHLTHLVRLSGRLPSASSASNALYFCICISIFQSVWGNRVLCFQYQVVGRRKNTKSHNSIIGELWPKFCGNPNATMMNSGQGRSAKERQKVRTEDRGGKTGLVFWGTRGLVLAIALFWGTGGLVLALALFWSTRSLAHALFWGMLESAVGKDHAHKGSEGGAHAAVQNPNHYHQPPTRPHSLKYKKIQILASTSKYHLITIPYPI